MACCVIFCLILLILFDIVDVLQNQLILLIILFMSYNIKQYYMVFYKINGFKKDISFIYKSLDKFNL